MFFLIRGNAEPCGMFTIGHLVLLIITSIFIAFAIKNTKDKNNEEIYKIIKILTIIICLLEVFKISFTLFVEKITNLNDYVPLYYCSLLIYAGLLSSFGKGKLKRTGDVFLATGGIIGGLTFMLFPTTSLPYYPAYHFVSIHSYFFHGTMLYLGLILNITNYIELEKKDIIYYAILLTIICVCAYIVNEIYGSNLMFISQNFPGTFLEVLYIFLGKYYTVAISAIQIILPFYAIFYCKKLIIKNIEYYNKFKKK